MMTTPSRLVVAVQIEDPSHLATLPPHWHGAGRPAHIDASRGELGTPPLPRLALAKARTEPHVGAVEAAAQPDARPHDPGGAQGPTALETTEAQERRAPAARLEAEGRLASLARVECDGPPTRRGAVSRRRRMVRQRKLPAGARGAQPDASAVEGQVSDAQATPQDGGDVDASRDPPSAERRPAGVGGHPHGAHGPRARERVPRRPAHPDAGAESLREPGREQAPREEAGNQCDAEGEDARRRPEDDRQPPPPHRCRLAGQWPSVNRATTTVRSGHAARRPARSPTYRARADRPAGGLSARTAPLGPRRRGQCAPGAWRG